MLKRCSNVTEQLGLIENIWVTYYSRPGSITNVRLCEKAITIIYFKITFIYFRINTTKTHLNVFKRTAENCIHFRINTYKKMFEWE